MTEAEAIHALLDQTGGFIWYTESGETSIAGVTEIDLGDSEISDDALTYLKYFPRLEWLCLEGTAVSDNGLRHLTKITTLKELVLCGSAVTADGVAALQRSLSTCKIEY